MHVDDVGADRHVNGDRNLEPRRRAEDAGARELRLLSREEPQHRLADTEARSDAVVDRVVQQPSCFFGHPEAARAERLVDVLGRGADQRDLEVVNDRRAVGGDRRDEPALHQVDQHRAEAGLDDVCAQPPDDAAVGALRVARSRARPP